MGSSHIGVQPQAQDLLIFLSWHYQTWDCIWPFCDRSGHLTLWVDPPEQFIRHPASGHCVILAPACRGETLRLLFYDTPNRVLLYLRCQEVRRWNTANEISSLCLAWGMLNWPRVKSCQSCLVPHQVWHRHLIFPENIIIELYQPFKMPPSPLLTKLWPMRGDLVMVSQQSFLNQHGDADGSEALWK